MLHNIYNSVPAGKNHLIIAMRHCMKEKHVEKICHEASVDALDLGLTIALHI
jgi:hypothetical protein